jgi:hypothetical protein
MGESFTRLSDEAIHIFAAIRRVLSHPPLLRAMRAAEISTIVLSIAGFVQYPQLFWLCVGLVHGAVALYCLEKGLEQKARIARTFIVLVPLVSLGILDWKVVFVSAPLTVHAFANDANYPSGTTMADIKWDEGYSEVKVFIMNSEDDLDYEDVDLSIQLEDINDSLINTIGGAQLNPIGGCEIRPQNTVDVSLRMTTLDNRSIDLQGGSTMASTSPSRVVCEKLNKNTEIGLAFAVVNLQAPPKDRAQCAMGAQLKKGEEFWAMQLPGSSCKDHLIVGPKAAMLGPKVIPDHIHISGQYKAIVRFISINQRVKVAKR